MMDLLEESVRLLSVLVAPTAFKGTLTPLEVASAIEAGIREALPEPIDVVLLPIADGGDGTIEAVHRALGGQLRQEQVVGPANQPVLCHWLKLETTALVELAACCGIALLEAGKLEPMNAHTYGLGQGILRAYEAGCTEINVALGGSASTDGGAGALKALGAVFFDKKGFEIDELGGGALSSIADCDLTALRFITRDCRVRLLTDVDNPLLGPRGSAFVFGPQKGASADQAVLLEAGLQNFAEVLLRAAGAAGPAGSDQNNPNELYELETQAITVEFPIRYDRLKGSGAAGGTAFGLACALGAEIVSGFDWMADTVQLDERIAAADLVITGEGKFDSQSLDGKAVGRLINKCAAQGKRICVISARPTETPAGAKVMVIVPNAHGNEFCGRQEIIEIVRDTVPRLFHD